MRSNSLPPPSPQVCCSSSSLPPPPAPVPTLLNPPPLAHQVNFAYKEAGEHKQALVKLRVCPSCATKLNYKKQRALAKAQKRQVAKPHPST